MFLKITEIIRFITLKEGKQRFRCVKNSINNIHWKVVIQWHLFSFTKEFYLFSELLRKNKNRFERRSKED